MNQHTSIHVCQGSQRASHLCQIAMIKCEIPPFLFPATANPQLPSSLFQLNAYPFLNPE